MTWSSRSIASRETTRPPTWRVKCRSGFVTLPPVLLQEQSAVVLLLEGALVSWSLAIDERGGHENLCGSARRSVIPYIHGRTGVVLLKSALPFSPPLRSGAYLGNYKKSRRPTGGPEVVKTLYIS
jgi:hypothetical protein